MVWFRVEPGMPTHPKFMRIPRAHRLEAIGLWTTAGAWSTGHEQDGYVPAFMVDEWGAGEAAIASLVAVGLWTEAEKMGESGYQFHGWAERQFTRAEIAEHRERERTRKEAYRRRKAEKAGNTGESPDGTDTGHDVGHSESPTGTDGGVPPLHITSPHLTSPHINNQSSGGAGGATAAGEKKPRRGTRIPDPFLLTAEMREWAAKETPAVDPAAETKVFVDYWRAVAGAKGVKLDWISTWRNSMRRKQDMGGTPGYTGPAAAAARAVGDEVGSRRERDAWLAAHGVPVAEYRRRVEDDGFAVADAWVNQQKAGGKP